MSSVNEFFKYKAQKFIFEHNTKSTYKLPSFFFKLGQGQGQDQDHQLFNCKI